MSVLLAAMLVAAQSGAPAQAPAPAASKKRPQVCEMIEVTGSRSRKRVCRDADGNLDLGPGVSHSLGGKSSADQPGSQAGDPSGQ